MRRRVWVVRGGEDGALVDAFVGEGVIAIGYPDIPDGRTVDQFDVIERLRRWGWTGPERRAELFDQFVRHIGIGDFVVMPDTARREVVVGTVDGGYEYDDRVRVEDHRHRRRVRWLARHGVSLLPDSSRELSRQRPVLGEQRSTALLEHLEAVERGEVGRDPLVFEEPRAARAPSEPRAPRAPREPRARTTSAPKAPAPPTTRTCTSCFLTKALDLFPGGGETCVDCA